MCQIRTKISSEDIDVFLAVHVCIMYVYCITSTMQFFVVYPWGCDIHTMYVHCKSYKDFTTWLVLDPLMVAKLNSKTRL
jgi:hypothetical protein